MVLDGRARQEDRLQRALAAAAASGGWDPKRLWPEYFASPEERLAVPSVGADMAGFRWERPSEESFRADLEAMMHGASRFVVPEEEPPPQPARPVTSLEWG